MPRLSLVTTPKHQPLTIAGHFLRRLDTVDRYRTTQAYPRYQSSLDHISQGLRECIENTEFNSALLRQADFLICDIEEKR